MVSPFLLGAGTSFALAIRQKGIGMINSKSNVDVLAKAAEPAWHEARLLVPESQRIREQCAEALADALRCLWDSQSSDQFSRQLKRLAADD